MKPSIALQLTAFLTVVAMILAAILLSGLIPDVAERGLPLLMMVIATAVIVALWSGSLGRRAQPRYARQRLPVAVERRRPRERDRW